jgi:hypothetical protein
MPRRTVLSATERETLLAFPDSEDELIRHYTFNETDLALIRQRRGAENRLDGVKQHGRSATTILAGRRV